MFSNFFKKKEKPKKVFTSKQDKIKDFFINEMKDKISMEEFCLKFGYDVAGGQSVTVLVQLYYFNKHHSRAAGFTVHSKWGCIVKKALNENT